MVAEPVSVRPYDVFPIADEASFREAVDAYLGNPSATHWLAGPDFVAIVYRSEDSPLSDGKIIEMVIAALQKANEQDHSKKTAVAKIHQFIGCSSVLDVDQMRAGYTPIPTDAYSALLTLVENLDDDLATHLRMRIAARRNGTGRATPNTS